jgi:uncharacterized membrane protein
VTTVWTAVLIASAVAYLLKLSGYLIPPRWLEHPKLVGALGVLPAALLAALVVTQTVTTGRHLTIDARVVAVAVAALALWRRAPFIVVVVLGAVSAALVRAACWG